MRQTPVVHPHPVDRDGRPDPAGSAPARPRWRVVVDAVLRPETAATQGRPLLDPTRWTGRHRWFGCAGLVVAIACGLIEAIQQGAQTGPTEGLRAFLAAAFGVGLMGLALSLRGLTVPGFLIGGLFVTAGILSWAYTDTPTVVWILLGLEGLLYAVWTFPWLRDLARLPRLGTAWLGLAYWLLGVVGAVLVAHGSVAGQRVVYAGLFTLGALAVVVATRKSGKDLTVGIVAAFLVALGLLFLVGSGNALDNVHEVPGNAWGAHQQYRFWGGPGLLYHPNSIAVVIVVITIRIAVDRTFERWQRYAVLVAASVILLLVNSRTGWLYLAAAAGLHALLVWRQRRAAVRGTGLPDDGLDGYPTRRGAWAGALLPLALVAVIGVGSGGAGFLGTQRYDTGGVTSGRSATWGQVWTEFKADNLPQKVFGDAKYARGYVIRTDTAANPKDRPKLTTDNAAVGSLRRGGVLGELAFLFGLGLLLWHAIRGVRRPTGDRVRPPAWFTIAAVGSLVTIATSDWLLGGTGGTLWIYLLAGEAVLVLAGSSGTGTSAGSSDGIRAADQA